MGQNTPKFPIPGVPGLHLIYNHNLEKTANIGWSFNEPSKKHVAKDTSQVAATFDQRHQTHCVQHVVVMTGQQWNSLTQFTNLCRQASFTSRKINLARLNESRFYAPLDRKQALHMQKQSLQYRQQKATLLLPPSK